MKKLILIGLLWIGATSPAQSVCYNNVCGKLVCPYGCVMQAVGNQCVAKYCTGWSKETKIEQGDSVASLGYCVSCANGDCFEGRTFLEAERYCKQYYAFGCFTRCQ